MNFEPMVNMKAPDLFEAHLPAFMQEMKSRYPNGVEAERTPNDALIVTSPEKWRFQATSSKIDIRTIETVVALKGRSDVRQFSIRFTERVPTTLVKSEGNTSLLFYSRGFNISLATFNSEGELTELQVDHRARPFETVIVSNEILLWKTVEGFIRWDGWKPFSLPEIKKVTPMSPSQYIEMMIMNGMIPVKGGGSETLPRFL